MDSNVFPGSYHHRTNLHGWVSQSFENSILFRFITLGFQNYNQMERWHKH